ncbi:MAG: glycoside hydrolase family 15 protein [Planctomycetes bacterium]|nr:glycoside hydrolase family 15 protein [Planctomycetota bacterium]
MAYLPIENYGVIGNLRTVALVGLDGSIDWWCHPRFDSPSVFGAILDDRKGGRFRIAPPDGDVRAKQMYLPDTNVLITRFLSPEGVGEIDDFMPISEPGGTRPIIRRVKVVRGAVRFDVECRPAFNYARDRHEVQARPEGVSFLSDRVKLGLATQVPLRLKEGAAVGEFVLRAGESATFVLSDLDEVKDCLQCLSAEEAEAAFRRTVEYWERWIGHSRYRGRWRAMVDRSALVLKLLTFEPTGAIVAAPTCSLPERIGGELNWDYRYAWIRDASFTLYALMRIGFTQEAHRFMDWIRARIHELNPDGSLQVMYSVEGRHDLVEESLDHLTGYRDSRPVRIGNAAHRQIQLDIYGELLDAVYLFNKYGTPIDYDLWVHLRRLLNWVVDNWSRPDQGIWEMRGTPRHFVYSKLMCWVALDRGLRLADKRSFPADREKWLKARDTIYEEIMSRGWNRNRQTFVQEYESDRTDASCLIMPLVFFLSPTDPRMLSTLEAVRKELMSDSLVHRYDGRKSPEGLFATEGTFSMCTFWLVEALTRAGRTAEARLLFEKMLGYSNHLGLYAEEIGPCGEALGNFPQAFTHLALISSAYNLNRALGDGDWK